MRSRHEAAPAPYRKLYKIRGSLRLQLSVGIGGILLLSLILSAISISHFLYRTEVAAWRGRQDEASRNAVKVVSDFVRSSTDSLAEIALLDLNYLRRDPRFMQSLIALNLALQEVILLDAEGTILAQGYRDESVLASQFTIQLSQWFQQARAGKRYYSGIQISSGYDPYVIVAQPTPSGGVIAARLRMAILSEVVADIHFGDTGRAYIVDRKGWVIAHTDHRIVTMNTSIDGRPEFQKMIDALDNLWSGEYVNFENRAVAGTSAKTGATDWILITELDMEEAYRTTRSASIVLVGGIFLILPLVMWGMYTVLTRLVFEPMERLRDGAERIGRGELNYRVSLKRADEIGIVATTFDEMAAKLLSREEQLTAQAVALAAEVNERKQLETALRESESRLRVALGAAHAGAWEWDSRTNRAVWSDENYRVLGYSPGSVEAHFDNWLSRVHSEDRNRVEKAITTAIAEKIDLQVDFRVVWPNGEIHWILDIGRNLFDDAGHPTGMIGIQIDVTERKQAELALQESEIRYRAIVEDQTELICRCLPDGTLTFVNEAYCRYFQKSRDELIEHPFLPLVLEEDRPIVKQYISDLGRDTPVTITEHRVIAPSGEIRWQQWTDRAIFGAEGQLLEVQSVGRDVTERRQAEIALQKINDDLEQRVEQRTIEFQKANEVLQNEIAERQRIEEHLQVSLAEKEVLLKEIHHRVKNNLQIISSLLNLQSTSIRDPLLTAQYKDSQSRIRTMGLIHERLYRSGDLAHIDFGSYLRELANWLVRAYRAKGDEITVKIEADNVLLDIDTAIPCGLLVNELMSNALKYAFPSGQRGTIQVELRRKAEDQLCLIVRDDGVGFPKGFDYQRTTSLGLQLVRTLSRQLGGTVEMYQDAGTQFDITFIASRAKNQEGL